MLFKCSHDDVNLFTCLMMIAQLKIKIIYFQILILYRLYYGA